MAGARLDELPTTKLTVDPCLSMTGMEQADRKRVHALWVLWSHSQPNTQGLLTLLQGHTFFFTRANDYIDLVQWSSPANAPVATPVINAFSVLKYVSQSARLYGLNLSGHMLLSKTAVGAIGFKGLLN